MWPVGLLGVLEYWKRGRDATSRAGLWIAVGLFFGAYVGAKITRAISPTTMKRAYGVFLLVVGTYFLLDDAVRPAPPKPAARRRAGAPAVRRSGPLTARLVLVDRPDVAVGVLQGELAPAPGSGRPARPRR